MNTPTEQKDYYEIQLKGKRKGTTLIDKSDYNKAKKYNWTLNKYGYVRAMINNTDTYLHRFILKPSLNELVDHINKNPKDNRRINLRIVTKSQNAMNSKIPINNTSGHKGVYLATENDRPPTWRAYIHINGKKINLGRHKTKEKAVQERKKAEKKYFKNYTSLI